jgi:putative ABC transport system permease protein
VLALVLVEVITPGLESVIARELSFDIWSYPGFLLKGLAFSVVIAFVSALYPAFFVTRFKVNNILKKNVSGLSSHGLLRTISVLQIVVFIVLISVAFTANRQLSFLQNENLGFDKEQQMVINLFSPEVTAKINPLQNELRELSVVSTISHAESIPTRVTGTNSFHGYDFTFQNFNVDEYFFETMGMEIVEGRGFLEEDVLTKDLVIINETAVKKLEFEGSAIGKTIKVGKSGLRIIGVVKDFHYGSKKQPIEATLFKPSTNDYGMFIAKLQGGNLKKSITDIKTTFSEVTNGAKMDFYFLDEVVDAQYRQENIMIKVVNAFSAMAALVAFIGLFGIAGYSVKRRIKEMGVRKVLGASFMDIQKSLNRSNLGRLVIAMALALPLIVYWMNSWLDSFAYRIEFPVSLVAAAFVLSALVILFTVSFHSIRAYLINPVEVLKDD